MPPNVANYGLPWVYSQGGLKGCRTMKCQSVRARNVEKATTSQRKETARDHSYISVIVNRKRDVELFYRREQHEGRCPERRVERQNGRNHLLICQDPSSNRPIKIHVD